MNMRTIGNNPAVSVRLSKEEWDDFATKGIEFFKKRNVGYIQVAGNLSFEKKSPYYKEKEIIDEANKLMSDEEKVNYEAVKAEIAKKKNG